MADELSISASFTFAKNAIEDFARAVSGLEIDVAGNSGVYMPGFAVASSETTLTLGDLSTLGWSYWHNLDSSYTINVKTAASGTIFMSLKPGEIALLRLGSGITAPVAISSAGSPLLEYFLLPP